MANEITPETLTDITLVQKDRTYYEIWGNRYCPCYDVKKVIPYLVARIETPTSSFYGSNNGSFSESGQWAWQEKAVSIFKDGLAVTNETGLTPRELLTKWKDEETRAVSAEVALEMVVDQRNELRKENAELLEQRKELLAFVKKVSVSLRNGGHGEETEFGKLYAESVEILKVKGKQ